MLTDLPPGFSVAYRDPLMEELARLTGGLAQPDRLEQGVYVAHINFSHNLSGAGLMRNEYPFAWGIGEPWDEDAPADYGVCDNYHQILGRWGERLADPDRKFIIILAEQRKADQPEEGGWRWHKWGPYIGTHEPQHEYLYDEDGIESVFCFSIYELN